MRKRFKAIKKKQNIIIKTLSIVLIIYVFFNLSYNLIYNLYLSKLTNTQIIEHIIKNTKNNKSSLKIFSNYQNPQFLLQDDFTFKDKTSEVSNEINTEKQIYIYMTHETESYQDKYLEVYNIKPTIKTMAYILQDYLTDYGIKVKVEEESVTKILKENNLSYKYSYDASRQLAEKELQNNSNYKLIIDLHRDSSPLTKTLISHNNTNYARILFVIGEENPDYQKNLQVATTLNDYLNKEIPNITRGIIKKGGAGVNGIYNQDLNPNLVLIELGGQYNEIEELNNTLKVLAKVILKYIEGVK